MKNLRSSSILVDMTGLSYHFHGGRRTLREKESLGQDQRQRMKIAKLSVSSEYFVPLERLVLSQERRISTGWSSSSLVSIALPKVMKEYYFGRDQRKEKQNFFFCPCKKPTHIPYDLKGMVASPDCGHC